MKTNEMENCRQKIIREVNSIHNVWMLKQIYLIIQNIKK